MGSAFISKNGAVGKLGTLAFKVYHTLASSYAANLNLKDKNAQQCTQRSSMRGVLARMKEVMKLDSHRFDGTER